MEQLSGQTLYVAAAYFSEDLNPWSTLALHEFARCQPNRTPYGFAIGVLPKACHFLFGFWPAARLG
jgi:hypothetical protein